MFYLGVDCTRLQVNEDHTVTYADRFIFCVTRTPQGCSFICLRVSGLKFMETAWPFPHGHKIITVTQAITFRKEKGLEEEEKEGIAPGIVAAKAFAKIFS